MSQRDKTKRLKWLKICASWQDEDLCTILQNYPTGNGKIVIKGSIKAMHEIFPATHFIRVHKSLIVALDKVKRIDRNRIIIHSHQIPIGRNYKEEVARAIGER